MNTQRVRYCRRKCRHAGGGAHPEAAGRYRETINPSVLGSNPSALTIEFWRDASQNGRSVRVKTRDKTNLYSKSTACDTRSHKMSDPMSIQISA